MTKNKKTQKASPKAKSKKTPRQRVVANSRMQRNLPSSFKMRDITRSSQPMVRTSRFLSDEERYKIAQINPFHPDAIGVRVPDFQSTPTITEHWRGSVSLSSSSTGTLGIFVRPAPGYTIGIAASSGSVGSLAYVADSSALMGIVADNNLNLTFKSYRMVAAGLRISNMANFNNVAGRFTCFPVCLGPLHGNQTAITAAGAGVTAGLLSVEGLSSSNNVFQLSLPGAKRINLDQLINNDFMMNMRPCGASAHNFKRCSDVADPGGASNMLMESEEYMSLAGAVNTASSSTMQSIDAQDWIGWYIVGANLPNSAVVADLEMIFHLEGRPPAVSNVGSGFVPSTPQYSNASSRSWESILRDVANFDVSTLMPPDTVMSGVGSLLGGIAAGYKGPSRMRIQN